MERTVLYASSLPSPTKPAACEMALLIKLGDILAPKRSMTYVEATTAMVMNGARREQDGRWWWWWRSLEL